MSCCCLKNNVVLLISDDSEHLLAILELPCERVPRDCMRHVWYFCKHQHVLWWVEGLVRRGDKTQQMQNTRNSMFDTFVNVDNSTVALLLMGPSSRRQVRRKPTS